MMIHSASKSVGMAVAALGLLAASSLAQAPQKLGEGVYFLVSGKG